MSEHKHNLTCGCAMPYPLADLAEGSWAIAQDGEAIVVGDRTAVRAIFNALTRNGYRRYLAYMSGLCRVTIRPEALTLVEGTEA